MSNTEIEIEISNERIKYCVNLYVRTELSSASVEIFDKTLRENGDDVGALYAAILNEQLVNMIASSLEDR